MPPPGKPAPARSKAKDAAPRTTARAGAQEGGKLLPPRDTVDVPRQPPKPGKNTPNEAAQDSRPPRDDQDESNWADGSKPRPHAKNARSHLL